MLCVIVKKGKKRVVWECFVWVCIYMLTSAVHILANRPDLVGTVPIWRPKPDVPPHDPKKPIRPDLSRSTPKKHDFKPAFCLFSLFFSWNATFFCVFWPFFMYPSVVGRYPNKKSVYIRALFWLKSSFFCHFPLNAKNFVYIFILAYFSCSKMCRIIDQNIKKCLFDRLEFQNFPGEHAPGPSPPDPPPPPRKARALPSQWSLRNHSLNHIISQGSRLQLSKSWQVCVQWLSGMWCCWCVLEVLWERVRCPSRTFISVEKIKRETWKEPRRSDRVDRFPRPSQGWRSSSGQAAVGPQYITVDLEGKKINACHEPPYFFRCHRCKMAIAKTPAIVVAIELWHNTVNNQRLCALCRSSHRPGLRNSHVPDLFCGPCSDWAHDSFVLSLDFSTHVIGGQPAPTSERRISLILLADWWIALVTILNDGEAEEER